MIIMTFINLMRVLISHQRNYGGFELMIVQ